MKDMRLPLQPLLDKTSEHSLRWFLGKTLLNHRRFKKHLNDGLTIWAADRFACRCGFHPSEIWPEWAEVIAK